MTEVNLETFARKVREMREAQKNYFMTKTNADRIAARRLEKQVDDLLGTLLDESARELTIEEATE